MAMPDPQAAAQRWSNGLAGAGQRMTEGVQAVTVAPGQAAARQKSVWVNNVTQSADKWAANVAKVSNADWQASMINKGIPRAAQGASVSVDKVGMAYSKLFPYIQTTVQGLPPRGNLQANIARATAFITKMAAYQK